MTGRLHGWVNGAFSRPSLRFVLGPQVWNELLLAAAPGGRSLTQPGRMDTGPCNRKQPRQLLPQGSLSGVQDSWPSLPTCLPFWPPALHPLDTESGYRWVHFLVAA